MIISQLRCLCRTENCFLFEGRVYELLYTSDSERKVLLENGIKHKYRFMLNQDDYDYVCDSKLRKRLDYFRENHL